MPKLKTNKSAKKRFKLTKKGKVKGFKHGRRNILSYNPADRQRGLRRSVIIEGRTGRTTRKLLPYG